jgi:hypothetical protein
MGTTGLVGAKQAQRELLLVATGRDTKIDLLRIEATCTDPRCARVATVACHACTHACA